MAPIAHYQVRPAAFSQRSSRRGDFIRFAQAAKAGVGPRQRSVSTFLKSGASVRSVASFLKSSASLRCLPRTFGGKFFDLTVAVQEHGGGLGADPRDAGVAVGRVAHEREQVRNERRDRRRTFRAPQPHRE